MMKVRSVEVLTGHRLALEFSDGSRGIADLSKDVASKAPANKPLRALRSAPVFRKAVLDHGAVEWPGTGVGMATEYLYALAHGLPPPGSLEHVLANEREMTLRGLRATAGLTQVDVALALEIDQGALSRFERQDDMMLSTLRRYVEALGGKLEVVAVLDHKRVAIRGV